MNTDMLIRKGKRDMKSFNKQHIHTVEKDKNIKPGMQ